MEMKLECQECNKAFWRSVKNIKRAIKCPKCSSEDIFPIEWRRPEEWRFSARKRPSVQKRPHRPIK